LRHLLNLTRTESILINIHIFTMPNTKNEFEETPIFRRYPPSGINILVTGAGLGGLSFAIEAHRKGHDVCVIDRRPDFDDYGKTVQTNSPA
jgi:NADPH-dependent 2,4-dienoyl-CoA reductase/sulfur reductase-like enzyme